MDVYSPVDFRSLMGTDVIARIGSSMAELTGGVAVCCLIQHIRRRSQNPRDVQCIEGSSSVVVSQDRCKETMTHERVFS